MFPCKHWPEMRFGEWKHSTLGFRTRRLRNSPGLLESAVSSQGCDPCGAEQGSPNQAKADPSPFPDIRREGGLSPQNPASYIRFLPWTGYPVFTKRKVWGGRLGGWPSNMNYNSPPLTHHTHTNSS